MSIIAVAVIAAVGVAGAAIKGAAAKKAAGAMTAGWNATKPLDIEEMKVLGKETDLQKYQDQFAAQAKHDPVLAKMRSQGSENFLSQLNLDKSGQTIGDKSTREVSELIASAKEGQQSAIDALMKKAKSELDAGATLPPEFQAELVKAGLEGAGAGGMGIEGRGAGGTAVRELLGAAGLKLDQQRTTNAINYVGAADSIRTGRMAALTGLTGLDEGVRNSKAERGKMGIGIGTSAMPSIGMSGTTAMALSARNNEFENNRKLGLAGVKAAKIQSQGDMWASILGSVGGAVSGGMSGGVGGGGTNWGSLFKTSGSFTPSNNTPPSSSLYGQYGPQ
jgi:hypothetical protein